MKGLDVFLECGCTYQREHHYILSNTDKITVVLCETHRATDIGRDWFVAQAQKLSKQDCPQIMDEGRRLT